MKQRFVMQHDSKSFCKHCHSEVELLIGENALQRSPMFYICWLCKKVFQIAVGEVPVVVVT